MTSPGVVQVQSKAKVYFMGVPSGRRQQGESLRLLLKRQHRGDAASSSRGNRKPLPPRKHPRAGPWEGRGQHGSQAVSTPWTFLVATTMSGALKTPQRCQWGEKGLLRGVRLAVLTIFSAEQRATSGIKTPGGGIQRESTRHTLTLPQSHRLSLPFFFVTKLKSSLPPQACSDA